MQRALQQLLKPIHLERLLQRRPVAMGLERLAIARSKDDNARAYTDALQANPRTAHPSEPRRSNSFNKVADFGIGSTI